MKRLIGLAASLAVSATAVAGAEAPASVHVKLGAQMPGPTSGRLLVFAKPVAAAKPGEAAKTPDGVDVNLYGGEPVLIAAQEIAALPPGAEATVDLDTTAWPTPFSRAVPGDYVVQAVLDPNHTYNYSGRGAGDVTSVVTTLKLPLTAAPTLVLDHVVAATPLWTAPPQAPKTLAAQLAAAKPHAGAFEVRSAALTRFFGAPTAVRAWVLTPPAYAEHPDQRYPTVFYTHGYGGTFENLTYALAGVDDAMTKGQMPPMIWVFLDESGPTGTHEFADGVNNGPWGQALTTEFIPALEARYRMDAKPSGRFLNGHSSGGWATLWLQTRYPKLFGGTWSTAPDPSDFHDFTNVDIYAPHANAYYGPDGALLPVARAHGKMTITVKDETTAEDVLGDYGGQMRSFDAVFSPRGRDGRPLPLYDHATGVIDPAVAAYWRDNYDIAWRLKRDWRVLKPDLDGKIHLIVGTADTFYLDGAARRLEAAMKGLGAKTDFRYVPDRTHFDLYKIGDDRRGLLKTIAWEMYAIARPGSKAPTPQGAV